MHQLYSMEKQVRPGVIATVYGCNSCNQEYRNINDCLSHMDDDKEEEM